MKLKIKDVIIALVASIVMYFVVGFPVGVAAAIATPDGYFEWYKNKGMEWLALPLWNFVTVVPAIVIPTILITFAMVRYFTSSWFIPCLTIVLADFIHSNVTGLLIWRSFPDYYSLNGISAVLPSMWFSLAVVVSGYLASKRITKPSS